VFSVGEKQGAALVNRREGETITMKTKVILTSILLVAFGVFAALWSRALPMTQGVVAAHQLNDDSIAGNAAAFWYRSNDLIGGVAFVVFLALLALIWLPGVLKALKNGTLVALFLALGFLTFAGTGCATRAETVSQGTGQQDVVELQPNQTAFLIPTIAGSLGDQQKFQSANYYADKKVPAKRILLDKDLIGGKWLPRNYVYIVDRTPVSRQWTEDKATGTSAANEALCAETNQSIRVCFQIAVAVAVTEDDAATYLYYYPADKLRDQQIGGVYVSTPLAHVVDNQVRNYALSILGRETKNRDLESTYTQTNDVVAAALKESAEFFKKQGISIIYLGMGGDLKLDPEIQAVINRLYVAQKEREIAKAQATTTAINAEAQKNALMLKGQGDAAALAELVKAMGGDTSHLGDALTGYRWDGSRLTVMLASTTQPAVTLPTPSPEPTRAPTPAQTPTPKK
jgi:hypothetical protein